MTIPQSTSQVAENATEVTVTRPVIKLNLKVATQRQQDYIEILCIDIDCYDHSKRNAILSHILNRPIKYLDEIGIDEVQKVIERLKSYKRFKKQLEDDLRASMKQNWGEILDDVD